MQAPNNKPDMAKQEPQNIALFGLGSMGHGMACSILRAGHKVFGYDVATAAMERFQSEGGEQGDLETISKTLDAVIVVVLNANQTQDVLFGSNGVVPQLRKGSVVLSCATVPPAFARRMSAQCADHGVHYLDAPISGGAVKAMDGQLSIMASGSAEAFDAARGVLDATAETVFELGDTAGAGSAMKSVNQMLAGVHIAAMAEALTFGLTQGISARQFVDVISKCAGTSWMLENRAPHIVDADYTPRSSVNIWPKDLGIVMEIAQSSGFEAPLTSAALQQFRAASVAGLGLEDDAAVAKIYAQRSGVSLPGEA
jgi:3-hydroxyisobutyrate dehydrogenase-like beta-hydroxyacid dehydrogenase